MEKEKLINLASDFSRHPGPRWKHQGRYSGEVFRPVLVEALKQSEHVTVNLDGTTGIGSSFLDESFGGLISKEGYRLIELTKRLSVISKLDESYLFTVNDSLQQAEREIAEGKLPKKA